MKTADEVRARVRQIIGEMSPLGPREATSEDDIANELGYDSLAVVELALVLESELGLQSISEDEAIDIVVVGDVEELVLKMGAAHE